MSITYKLFGVPKTFEEFVDKVYKEKSKIDVSAEGNLELNFFTYDCSYRIILKTKNSKLKLYKFKWKEMYFNSPRLPIETNFQYSVLFNILNTAKRLRDLNLEVLINGEPFDNAKEKYEKHIEYLKDIDKKISPTM